jgi:hypothetical protein
MKILVNIVLLMFLSFLSAPTIVSLIEDEADVSVAYSLTEEEVHKEVKEVVVYHPLQFDYCFPEISGISSKINSENLQRHDNVFEEIFSPPPENI